MSAVRKRRGTFTKAISLSAVALFLTVWAAYLAGARSNRTNSLRFG